MPRRKTKNRTVSRRGGSLKAWVQKSHDKVKNAKGYSRLAEYVTNRSDVKNFIQNKSGSYHPMVQRGIKMGIEQLKQKGYGTKLAGRGRNRGSGTKLAGLGKIGGCNNRMKY